MDILISKIRTPALAFIMPLLFFLATLRPASGMEGFSLDVKATALAGINGLANDSDQNPGNRLAQIPGKESVLTLKPDLSLAYDDWLFSAKPRLELSQSKYEINGVSDTVFDKHADIPEFLIRRKLTESLFASYGRENLQWGPSFLYSPSNPFFNDNGKKSLIQDLEGKGMAKLVMVHDFAWSASLIYNTDKGAFDDPDFQKTLALKIDYSGDNGYAALILSHTDHGKAKLGAFAGTTLSDALIVYGETSLQKGTKALYPVAVPGPLTWDMAPVKDNDDLYAILLFGATYTLESGDSLCLEYLYYGQGYDSNESSDFNNLKHTAKDLFVSASPLSGYGHQLLGKTASSGLDFFRQNYLMLQYLNDDIIGSIDLVSRVTLCLDDGSSRLYSSLSYDLNDHMALKTSGMINTGGADASFGTYLDYQVQVALEYTY